MKTEKLINLGLEIVYLEMNNGNHKEIKRIEGEIMKLNGN